MLIMRQDQAAVDRTKEPGFDFETVINAMGAYNESMI